MLTRAEYDRPELLRRMPTLLCLCLPLVLPCLAYGGWTAWVPWTAPSGAQGIVKDTPGTTSWVHYDNPRILGWSSVETATFHVQYNGKHDIDHRECWENGVKLGEEYVDFGLGAEVWTASVGQFKSAGVWSPPTSPNDAINIFCSIPEGPGGYQGEQPINLTWNEMLKAFRVGVKMQPGIVTWYEDDVPLDLTRSFEAGNVSDLAVTAESTVLGVSDVNAQSTGWNLSCSWTTITDPEHASLVAKGVIQLLPFIQARYSTLNYDVWGAGMNTTATSSQVLTSLAVAGSIAPPLAPAAAIAAIAWTPVGIGSDICLGVTASAQIDYVAACENKKWPISTQCWNEDPQPTKANPRRAGTAALDELRVQGFITDKADQTYNGTAKVVSHIDIRDNSPVMVHGGNISVADDGGRLKWGAQRPQYLLFP